MEDKIKRILEILIELPDEELELLSRAMHEIVKKKCLKGIENTDSCGIMNMDDEENGWWTTENGKHYHVGENGEVDKGPNFLKGKPIDHSKAKKTSGETGSTSESSGAPKETVGSYTSGGNGGNGGGKPPVPPKASWKDRMSKNKCWADAKDRAEKLSKGAFPEDAEHSTGTNYKGKQVDLKIQGAEAQKLYNELQSGKIYTADELKQNPVVAKMDAVSADLTEKIGDTVLIDTPERQAMRDEIQDEFLSHGSPQLNPETGKYELTGKIKKEHKAIIYTGLPAAGKSTAVNRECGGMFVLDSDEVKQMIPEFEATGGAAANAVHKESKGIMKNAFDEFLTGDRNGENLAIPIIGDKSKDVYDKYIAKLEAAGYDVEVRGIVASPDKSSSRVVSRAIETGRIIPSEVVLGYGTKCDTAYEELKQMTGKNGKPYVREAERYNDEKK